MSLLEALAAFGQLRAEIEAAAREGAATRAAPLLVAFKEEHPNAARFAESFIMGEPQDVARAVNVWWPGFASIPNVCVFISQLQDELKKKRFAR